MDPGPRLRKLEADILAQGRMLDTIRQTFELYGFEALETPFVEYTESLGKELGLYTDPYMYMGALGDEIHRRYFDLLDAPVWRVHGGEASPSISKVLERAAIAQAAEVTAALDEIARY